MNRACMVLLLALSAPAKADQVYRVAGDVKPPKPIHTVAPEYSGVAADACIEGTALLEVVVDETGRPADIEVISPLGYMLDENAVRAVQKWTFEPATKGSRTVKARVLINVDFRIGYGLYYQKVLHYRWLLARARADLTSEHPKARRRAVRAIRGLSRRRFSPAMYDMARAMIDGTFLPKDEDKGFALLAKLSDAGYGPAMCDVARKRMASEPQAREWAMALLRKAAVRGSIEAQKLLGATHDTGDGVGQDHGNAIRYFRLCAAAGDPECQFHLGRLLLQGNEIPDRRYVQAIAWLELAASKGQQDSMARLEEERSRMTAEQRTWVADLRPELERPVQTAMRQYTAPRRLRKF